MRSARSGHRIFWILLRVRPSWSSSLPANAAAKRTRRVQHWRRLENVGRAPSPCASRRPRRRRSWPARFRSSRVRRKDSGCRSQADGADRHRADWWQWLQHRSLLRHGPWQRLTRRIRARSKTISRNYETPKWGSSEAKRFLLGRHCRRSKPDLLR